MCVLVSLFPSLKGRRTDPRSLSPRSRRWATSAQACVLLSPSLSLILFALSLTLTLSRPQLFNELPSKRDYPDYYLLITHPIVRPSPSLLSLTLHARP